MIDVVQIHNPNTIRQGERKNFLIREYDAQYLAKNNTKGFYDPEEYRGFNIQRERVYSFFEIHTLDGSETPRYLQVKFTKLDLAKQHIDKYLEDKIAADEKTR